MEAEWLVLDHHLFLYLATYISYERCPGSPEGSWVGSADVHSIYGKSDRSAYQCGAKGGIDDCISNTLSSLRWRQVCERDNKKREHDDDTEEDHKVNVLKQAR